MIYLIETRLGIDALVLFGVSCIRPLSTELYEWTYLKSSQAQIYCITIYYISFFYCDQTWIEWWSKFRSLISFGTFEIGEKLNNVVKDSRRKLR